MTTKRRRRARRRSLDSGIEKDLKQVLARLIRLGDQITEWSGETPTFQPECLELKSRTERISNLLRQAARSELYERPTRRIMKETGEVLGKAHFLVSKCRTPTLLSRVFTINPAAAFKKMSTQLDNCIGDISWLLRVSKPNRNGNDDDSEDDESHLGLPPIASNEPILGLIWEHIAKLHTGSVNARAAAAAYLASFARDNVRHVNFIVEEGGIPHLLKLLKEGCDDGQESAARALGLLGRDPNSAKLMAKYDAGSVFSDVLIEGSMKVQSEVAWAVSELATQDHYPNEYQDMFAQSNAILFLVSHLAFETVPEHSKYSDHPKATSTQHALFSRNSSLTTFFNDDDDEGNSNKQGHSTVQSTTTPFSKPSHSNANPHRTGIKPKGRESENPDTKAAMKSMATRALWHLARGNDSICKTIAESKALHCFAVLLGSDHEEVRLNSAKILMEIARVAEQTPELRRSAFKPASTAAKALVDHLLRIVEKGEYSNLLVPSIITLGCLSRTFRSTENRIIAPLVRLIEEKEPEVMREALLALTKFARTENFLHSDHCEAIVASGGAKPLVQLVYFAEQEVQLPALVLLCYIALHVPETEDLAQANVRDLLVWASKNMTFVAHDPSIDALLPEADPSIDALLLDAKSRLEIYRARGTTKASFENLRLF